MTPLDAFISAPYLEEQRILHARPKGYGAKGGKWAATVLDLVCRHDCGSVLDYGCGQGGLARALEPLVRRSKRRGLVIREYDPAIPGKDALPAVADLVVSTDVLEHIEPERLGTVLAHIRGLARKAIFVVIALDPANKVLSDGRNAHLIQQRSEWWEDRISEQGMWILTPSDLVLPPHMTLEKQRKRWIAVLHP